MTIENMMEEYKMGIFTGTETLFFFAGALTTLLIVGLIYLQKKYTIKWYSNSLAGIGIFLIIFTLLWSVSSIQEGEPQAANMGLLVFGVPALLIFGITRKLISKDSKLVKKA